MASVRRRGAKFTGLYRDANGAQKSAGSFGTEEEALARATVLEFDARPPEYPEVHRKHVRGKVTVAAYAPGWLDNKRCEPNTRLAYGLSLKHIIKVIGDTAVADVTTDDIVSVIRHLERLGRSDATIRHAVVVARLMFEATVRQGIRGDNPAKDDDAKVKIRHQREMAFATREQAKAIEESAPERHWLLIRSLSQTGCRWSEIIAVKGTDIEQRGGGYVLKIRRTVNETWGTALYEKPYGKTDRATRDIPVTADLARDLMASGGGLRFTAAGGGYLRRWDFSRRVWKPAIAKAGIPRLRIHDARHSHASWLANDPAVPLASVRDRLGHSSIAVTSRYVHTMPGDDPCLAALARMAS
jgi:integrase